MPLHEADCVQHHTSYCRKVGSTCYWSSVCPSEGKVYEEPLTEGFAFITAFQACPLSCECSVTTPLLFHLSQSHMLRKIIPLSILKCCSAWILSGSVCALQGLRNNHLESKGSWCHKCSIRSHRGWLLDSYIVDKWSPAAISEIVL